MTLLRGYTLAGRASMLATSFWFATFVACNQDAGSVTPDDLPAAGSQADSEAAEVGVIGQAVGKDPTGGSGTSDCKPRTMIYANGNKITFNGWTKCEGATGFELQIVYGNDKNTKYSNLKHCRGPLDGDSTSGELTCGIEGIYGTITDDKPGKQQWCVGTFITVGAATTGRSTSGATKETSLLDCLYH